MIDPRRPAENSESSWIAAWLIPTILAVLAALVTLVFGILRICEVIDWGLIWIFFPVIAAEGVIVLTIAILLIAEVCKSRGSTK